MNFPMRIIMPKAFDLFQFWIGGTVAKRKLVLDKFTNQKHILEVGCSTGNIATAFLKHEVDYIGLDIDGAAIDFAKRKFIHKKNFSFVCNELQKQAFNKAFDFIIFSGVLHHVNDATATDMLEYSCQLRSPEGIVVVSDPIAQRPNDSALAKLYGKMERGKYVRSMDELSGLLGRLSSLRVTQQECHGVSPFPTGSIPTVAHFAVYLLR